MTLSHSTSIRMQHDDDELELPVEVVAERLGLPASMLIRRIEAGDIPARQVEDADGRHYRVRLADLGPSTEQVAEITGTVEPLTLNGRAAHAEEPEIDSVADDDAVAVADDEDDDDDDDDDDDVLAELVPPPPSRSTLEVTPLELS